jgi:hypothetical protein
MIKRLMAFCVPFVLLGVTACGGPPTKPVIPLDTKATMEKAPVPPPLPRHPPKDSPAR